MKLLKALENIRERIRSFYPIELLFANLKYNLVSLIYWYILFSIVNGGFGNNFGVPFLIDSILIFEASS